MRNTTIASAAIDPSACTKSARASWNPRLHACRPPAPSSTFAGTARPTAANQSTPGTMPRALNAGIGKATSMATPSPARIRSHPNRSPEATMQAPTYATANATIQATATIASPTCGPTS